MVINYFLNSISLKTNRPLFISEIIIDNSMKYFIILTYLFGMFI